MEGQQRKEGKKEKKKERHKMQIPRERPSTGLGMKRNLERDGHSGKRCKMRWYNMASPVSSMCRTITMQWLLQLFVSSIGLLSTQFYSL